jgi:hypothetical protein
MTEKKHESDQDVAAHRAEEDAAVERHRRHADVNLDASLAGFASFIPVLTGLLNTGVTVTQLAEQVVKFAAPSDLPALEALAEVLQEAGAVLEGEEIA